METRSGPDADLRGRAPTPAPEQIREVVGPIEGGAPPLGAGPEPGSPRPRVTAAPVAPRDRPWVGARFFGGLAIAVPISLLLWAGIIWLVIQLFFS